jgi:hypothetical protein
LTDSRFQFDEETHQYRIDGVVTPSVTQVLSAAGFTDERWYKGRNRGKGTSIHEGCTLVDQGLWDPETTHPDIVPYIHAYESFIRDTGFKAEIIEEPLFSTQWRYAGRCDRWGWVSNGPGSKKRWLIDLKSGSHSDAADIQIALYDVLLSGQLGHQTDERVVLVLKDDGKYKIHSVPATQKCSDVNVGLAAVLTWHWRSNHGKL